MHLYSKIYNYLCDRYLSRHSNKHTGMKKTILFASVIALAIVSTFFGCVDSDKDLYDASFKMPNPMGDGFAAPDGFDWSTMANIQATIEVNDKFDGEYYYTVELYDANPIISKSAQLLDRDVAKKGDPYSSKISLNKSISTLFIKEISPTGLYTVRAADISNGKVDCNFSTTSPVARSLAVTRGLVAIKEPDATYFPKESPTTKVLTNIWDSGVSSGTSFNITKASPPNLNFGGKENIKLYVTEDVTLTGLYLAKDCHLYILPGIKVTIPQAKDNGQSNCLISIGEGASLIVEGDVQLDSDYRLFNLGTFNAKNLMCTNNSFFYNGGTVNVEEKISGEDSNCTMLNTGIAKMEEFYIQGGSHLLNQGKMEVEEKTVVNCTNGSWENEGEWITNDMLISAWNEQIYNRCKLLIKDEFDMQEATLTNDGGSYVQCEELYMNNSKVILGGGALFKVTEEAEYGYQTSDKGFRGTGNEKALVVITKAVAKENKENIIHYTGALQIVCSDHPNAEISPGRIRWTMKDGAEWAEIGKNTITIPKTDCNEGFNGGTPGTPTDPDFPIIVEDNKEYSYIFEDQWPLYGDYDMNDIVLTVNKRKITKKKQKVSKLEFSIELSAVGATKLIAAALMLDDVKASDITSPIVFDNGTPIGFDLNSNNIEKGQEFAVIPLFADAHVAMGNNRRDFINTVSGATSNTNQGKKINFTINFEKPLPTESFNINKFNIFIITDQNGIKRREIHVAGYQPTQLADTSIFGGNNDNSSLSSKRYYLSNENLAWGVMVPTNFKWPLEYVNIKLAYEGFASWVTSGGQENEHWWNNFNESKVFQTNKN